MMHTIRFKVIIFFVAYLGFMTLNTAMYCWNIVSFRDRLEVLDQFHGMLSDILEIRRYEKNFFFYPEPGSLAEALIYLDKTEQSVYVLHDKIVGIVGQDQFNTFTQELRQYKQHLGILAGGGQTDLTQTRSLGTSMIGFAQSLLSLKKKRIHSALIHILYIPTAVMVGLALLIVALFSWQVKKAIDRLTYVQQAAQGVARGDYEAIEHIRSDDEASQLMRVAFTKMADEIESRQKQLLESRKLVSIGTLTSGIAHELNNPLNNVSLTADTLLEDIDELPPAEVKEMLQDIIDETARASEVVRNLLDFSREERQAMVSLSVGDIVTRSLKLIGNQLMLDHITVVTQVPENLPEIRGNLHYLEQVFINLCMNAAQAMSGGGTLTISAHRESATCVCIEVADTGCGMTAEIQERIFDPFFTTKPVGMGTGLGLAILYGIIKKHGGSIDVQSTPGQGTTFYIHLLIVDEEEIHEQAQGIGY
jgi:signal transduction histidine kinase